MLQAILLNKAGRSISSTEVYWRELFTASEDSLTSTIFENLFHLPEELFWQIMHNACYDNQFPKTGEKISSVIYWPHWNSSETDNSNYVEPDLFIRTTNYDFIIEAKKYDNNQQKKGQWINEFQSYLNEFKNDNKQVILFAIGGINGEETEFVTIENIRMPIVKCRWNRILHEIKFVKSKLEKDAQNKNCFDSRINICNDLILGFRIHGYATGEWFEHIDVSHLQSIKDVSLKEFILNPYRNNPNIWKSFDGSLYTINTSSLKFLNNIIYE